MDATPTKPIRALFFRGFWIFFGPFLLLFVAAFIIQSGAGWFTGQDLLFGVLLLAMILCRWSDFRTGESTDSYGEPVTASDLRRYTVLAVVVGAAVWAVANVLGNHLL